MDWPSITADVTAGNNQLATATLADILRVAEEILDTDESVRRRFAEMGGRALRRWAKENPYWEGKVMAATRTRRFYVVCGYVSLQVTGKGVDATFRSHAGKSLRICCFNWDQVARLEKFFGWALQWKKARKAR